MKDKWQGKFSMLITFPIIHKEGVFHGYQHLFGPGT